MPKAERIIRFPCGLEVRETLSTLYPVDVAIPDITIKGCPIHGKNCSSKNTTAEAI